MVATLTMSETNGAGATVTDSVGNMNYGSVDAINITPAASPVTIPGAGTAYSYEKYNRVRMAAVASSHVDNLRVWLALGNNYVTGETLWFNLLLTSVNSAYATPVNTLSSKATVAFAVAQPAKNLFTPQAGDQLVAVNDRSYYIVWQARIASTASPGNVTPKTIRVTYDEQ